MNVGRGSGAVAGPDNRDPGHPPQFPEQQPFSWDRRHAPFLALAPMEDVTDTVFRTLVRAWSNREAPGRGDAVVMFTEFTRVDAALRSLRAVNEGRSLAPRLQFSPGEHPIVAQLWGTRPEEFSAAATAIEQLGFDGLDLNMGCPVRKIRRQGAGSGLIGDPVRAAEIIHACREGTRLPLSVKTRIGLESVQTEEWCGHLLEQPIDALTVHPRTAAQMSEGDADWGEVRRVVAIRDALFRSGAATERQVAILGNGDIRDLEDGRTRAEDAGADGIMIGRGIFENPLLFAGSAANTWTAREASDRLAFLSEHITRFTGYWGNQRNYEILKKFFRNYVTAGPAGETLLAALYETHSAADALALIARARDA